MKMTRIYDMNPNEIKIKYQEVIQKHLEAKQAYKLMNSREGKDQQANWVHFEAAYPPAPTEVKKMEFLRLMIGTLNDNVGNNETVESKDDTKDPAATKMIRAKKAFKSAYPDYERSRLPNTPAKMAYDRYKAHFNAHSDLSDAKLIGECEKVVLTSPDAAEYIFHISSLTDEAWPEAESVIAESPWWSYMYAKMILKGPFFEGESVIATSGHYAYLYARFVIKGRFIQGEPAISLDPRASLLYAQWVIEGRFALGEVTILAAEKSIDAPTSAVNLAIATDYRDWCVKIGTPLEYN
jgi:hypothetical protein